MAGNGLHTILLIISPNFGIVDSWLPILYELKRREPALRIAALVTKKDRIVSQARPEDVLTQLTEPLLDEVLFQTWYGRLVSAGSLAEANAIQGREARPAWLGVLLARLKRFAVSRWLVPVLDGAARFVALRRPGPSRAITLDRLAETVGAVCFDVSEEKVELVQEAQRVFGKAHWFSLPHGIDPRREGAPLTEHRRSDRLGITAYVASRTELGYYRATARVPEERLRFVGVPRHAPGWLDTIRSRSSIERTSQRPYIFLVSRPANAAFFPRDRKVASVGDIRRLAEAIEHDVIVRLHPKESEEGIYTPLFDASSPRSTWSLSTQHPFVLGSAAAFTVTFFSSVAVDMVVLGVPAIERCDFTGLTSTQLVRDDRGASTSVYQLQGLALSARSYDELTAHVARIRADRAAVVRELQSRYRSVYTVIDDPVGLIATDVGACLTGGRQ